MNLDEFVRAGPKIFDRKHIQGNKGPNQLLYDFGVVNEEDDKEVQEKIEEIDKTFHLVMILENFQVYSEVSINPSVKLRSPCPNLKTSNPNPKKLCIQF